MRIIPHTLNVFVKPQETTKKKYHLVQSPYNMEVKTKTSNKSST